jgi:glutamate/tyrosine decarboxylase-like PLP-dependent enzyme
MLLGVHQQEEPLPPRSEACDEVRRVDKDVISVFVILGSTYTGHYDHAKEMSNVRPLSSSSALRAVLTLRSC